MRQSRAWQIESDIPVTNCNETGYYVPRFFFFYIHTGTIPNMTHESVIWLGELAALHGVGDILCLLEF